MHAPTWRKSLSRHTLGVKNRAPRFYGAASVAAHRHQIRAIPNLARESLFIMVQNTSHAPFQCIPPFVPPRTSRTSGFTLSGLSYPLRPHALEWFFGPTRNRRSVVMSTLEQLYAEAEKRRVENQLPYAGAVSP